MHDATFASLSEEIDSAKAALLSVLKAEPGRRWHPFELKTVARNGWSAAAMTLALESLIDQGDLCVTDDLLVKLPR